MTLACKPKLGDTQCIERTVIDSSAWTEIVIDDPAHSEIVVDSPAWTEIVIDVPGATRIVVDTPAWTETVHHDAVYETVCS